MKRIEGPVALVTGASSGIGEATAERLVKAGYKVYGTCRRGAHGGKRSFEMLSLDVTRDESVEAAVAEVIRREGRIDLLVNNAGFSTAPTGAEESSTEQARAVFDTNFFGEAVEREATDEVIPLPLLKVEPPPQEDMAQEPGAERPRVLWADDSADMREYVRRLLAPRYEVEAVSEGLAALEAARSRRPALVLADVMMPRLDGFGLLRELRADPALCTVPVVLLTARAGEESSAQGLESAADDYVVKPFSARELLARVKTHIEQARLREEAERATALREENRRKDDFLAMLSHELRNPLAAIRNAASILDRAEPGGEHATRAKEILGRQLDHLSRLVNDLLDVTRIARGKIRLERSRVELRDIVRRAIQDHALGFADRGIALELRSDAVPLWIDADPTRILQALVNLLHNASKFTNSGGHVVVFVGREEGCRAVIRVTDDGAGIAPDLLPRLFQPFVQAEEELDRGGLGIGLALVKGVVDLHDGTVEARSDGVGRGAEFTIRLLCLPRTAQTKATTPRTRQAGREEGAPEGSGARHRRQHGHHGKPSPHAEPRRPRGRGSP